LLGRPIATNSLVEQELANFDLDAPRLVHRMRAESRRPLKFNEPDVRQ
jgi:hypothetical protein